MYALTTIFEIGPYKIDLLDKQFRFKRNGLPWIILNKRNKDGSISVRAYLRQPKSKSSAKAEQKETKNE